MIHWIKEKLGIIALENENSRLRQQLSEHNQQTNNQIESHRKFVHSRMEELREYTRVDADIGYRSNNTIILSGVYRNKAYVRFFDVGDGEFKHMVEQLHDMTGYAVIRNLDKPPGIRGAFDVFEL